MPVLSKGSFEIDLGFLRLGGELDEADRQCAWALFTELSTRVAVTGKTKDPDCTDFSGEDFVESLDSLHAFFREARAIMREFPVGTLKAGKKDHLGALIHRAIRDVLRPFLETWQADFRFWWETAADKSLPPFERQEHYPRFAQMRSQWSDLRVIMRAIQDELVAKYKLIDVSK